MADIRAELFKQSANALFLVSENSRDRSDLRKK